MCRRRAHRPHMSIVNFFTRTQPTRTRTRCLPALPCPALLYPALKPWNTKSIFKTTFSPEMLISPLSIRLGFGGHAPV